MSAADERPSFETRLDWSAPDQISETEAAGLVAWYEEAHGAGSIELTRFVPFLIENRPGALKRYRRYAQVVQESCEFPQLFIALLFLHYYMRIGNARGVLYEVIAARKWGATKAEVLDLIQLTFLVSGPFGGNAAAELSTEYLREWSDDEARAVPDAWPEEWDAGRHDRGGSELDFESAALSETELGSLLAWHASVGDGVPAHVELFARHAPALLKALQLRAEHAFRASCLPTQLIPMLELHWAVATGRPRQAAGAARSARRLGVSKGHVMGVIGFGALYSDEFTLDELAIELREVLDDWS
jgi:alkylhydroperoxidase/carboxymuconolactone decarboxylase family protein YurZ